MNKYVVLSLDIYNYVVLSPDVDTFIPPLQYKDEKQHFSDKIVKSINYLVNKWLMLLISAINGFRLYLYLICIYTYILHTFSH